MPMSLRTVAAGLVITALGTGGCAMRQGAHEPTFPRPEVITDDTVCQEWTGFDQDVRANYAMHRLAEMRADDGLDPAARPPRESQGEVLRRAMESQCGRDTMERAAIWRVAHDQYTRLYVGGVLLD